MALLCPDNLASHACMKALCWIIVAGCVARTMMGMVCSTPTKLRQLEPSVVAANLNAGRGFVFEQYGAEYRAWKEPLYIILLSWITRWSGQSDRPIVVFQTLFGLGSAMGAALIAKCIFGNSTKAAMTGLIVAVNPFLVYYDTRLIHPLSMDTCFFIITSGAILIAASERHGSLWKSLAAGIVMGVALWQRAALLAAVAGLAADGATVIHDAQWADISYPGFFEMLARLTG